MKTTEEQQHTNIVASLAREFALDETRLDASDPNLSDSEIDGIRRDVGEFAERVINFLLRNHYIVEKETVAEHYRYAVQGLREMEGRGCTLADRHYNEGDYNGRITLLEDLFPDLEQKQQP